MHNPALHDTSLFKLTFLVAGIVVAMFFATVLVALACMPSQLIAGMPFEDITFLFPLALGAVCSASVLAWYVRTHKSKAKGQ